VAAEWGTTEFETLMDLVLDDGSRVEAIFFLMCRENLEGKVALPWVSFCSDEASLAPEGVFLQSNPHPRAYGNFACLFATFVRERGLISLEEAVRRASAMPADHFGLQDRGRIQAGAFADLVIFDPDTIQDHATYADPHQLATGVCDVIVNGVITLREGEPTGRMAGRVLRRAGTSEER
jgi:N-acyl-D-amino-acid deacylase